MPQLMDPDAYDAAGARRRPRGDAGRLDPLARRAGRVPGDPARRPRPTSACWPRRSWPTTPRSASASSTWRWCCCSSRWRASAPPWSAPAGPRARSRGRSPSSAGRALALGRGQPMPPHAEHPPLEFEPVFGAFERMAADIRSSQQRAGGGPAANLRRARDGGDRRRGRGSRGPGADRQPAGRGPGGRPSWRRATPLLDRPRARVEPASPRQCGRFLRAPGGDEAIGELEVGGRRHLVPARVAGPRGARRGHRAQRRDRRLARRAGAGLGRDGAAGGARDQEPAHARCASACSTCAGSIATGATISTDARGDRGADAGARSTGWTRSPARSAVSRRPPTTIQPLDRIDLGGRGRRGGPALPAGRGGVRGAAHLPAGRVGAARADEVKEVVVNLLENARNAGARVVDVTVGPGRIEVTRRRRGDSRRTCCRGSSSRASRRRPAARVWASRSCGGWWRAGAGRIEVESEVGRGTVVTVRLPD